MVMELLVVSFMVLKRMAVDVFNRIVKLIRGIRIMRSASRSSVFTVLKERGLELIYITVFFTFTAGVVNGLLEGTNERVQRFMIYPGRGIQTPSETFAYLFAFILGTIGVYLVYQGGRQTVRRRISDFYITLGFTVLLVALALTYYILSFKAGV